jgi:hypothetical protein
MFLHEIGPVEVPDETLVEESDSESLESVVESPDWREHAREVLNDKYEKEKFLFDD